VVDFNSFVKMIHTTQAKWFIHEPIDGLCADYGTQPALQESTGTP